MGVNILNRQVTLSGCVPSERIMSANVLSPNSVRRSLFGEIDHQESVAFFEKEFAKMEQDQMKQWNFDFVNENPLPGEFKWEKVNDHHSHIKSHKSLIKNTSNSKVTKSKSLKRYSIKNTKSIPIRINHDSMNRDCKQTTITDYMSLTKKLIENHMDLKSIASKRNMKN